MVCQIQSDLPQLITRETSKISFSPACSNSLLAERIPGVVQTCGSHVDVENYLFLQPQKSQIVVEGWWDIVGVPDDFYHFSILSVTWIVDFGHTKPDVGGVSVLSGYEAMSSSHHVGFTYQSTTAKPLNTIWCGVSYKSLKGEIIVIVC